MFDSLADRMKQDDHVETTPSERLVRWALVLFLSVVLFGGLYFGVRLLE